MLILKQNCTFSKEEYEYGSYKFKFIINVVVILLTELKAPEFFIRSGVVTTVVATTVAVVIIKIRHRPPSSSFNEI